MEQTASAGTKCRLIPNDSPTMTIQKIAAGSPSEEQQIAIPTVRAAGILGSQAATEVIDVDRLSKKDSSIIQYVEVADAEGRLYCVGGLVNTSYWLKIISLAKDCYSCNVVLMTTDKGVVLKTLRIISPGEPLVMWFEETVLALMDMPFLTPTNIQSQNRYICHMCNRIYEYPNPLKIHLALKCNQLSGHHLWEALASAFSSSPNTNLSLSIYPQSTFKFELTTSPSTYNAGRRTSPFLLETTESTMSPIRYQDSSNRQSPLSSNQPSPSSSARESPSSSSPVSTIGRNFNQIYSAFKPYINQAHFFAKFSAHPEEMSALIPYTIQPNSEPLTEQVAHMEKLIGNLCKTKKGHLCIYCGKQYSRKYGLKIHIRTHTGYKPLKCKYCSRPFGDPSNLNKHVRLHSDGESRYSCVICGKVLVRRRDLERHMKSRHHPNAEQQNSESSSDELEV